MPRADTIKRFISKNERDTFFSNTNVQFRRKTDVFFPLSHELHESHGANKYCKFSRKFVLILNAHAFIVSLNVSSEINNVGGTRITYAVNSTFMRCIRHTSAKV